MVMSAKEKKAFVARMKKGKKNAAKGKKKSGGAIKSGMTDAQRARARWNDYQKMGFDVGLLSMLKKANADKHLAYDWTYDNNLQKFEKLPKDVQNKIIENDARSWREFKKKYKAPKKSRR